MNSLFKAIARKESLIRTRVSLITNLLQLPDKMREFLLGLADPREIRRYSERKLCHGVFVVADNFFVDSAN